MISVQTYPSLEQAAGAVNDQARFFGGGTLLMRSLNYGEQDFSTLVRSSDPEAKTLRREGDRIRIGAAVTMSDIMKNPDVAFLSNVAASVGGPAVRNMATVGGNLFAHHPYGDMTVALLALEGQVSTIGGGEIELGTFLTSRETFRGVVSAVTISSPGNGEFRFRKISRVKPKGVSVMSIAAWLSMQGGSIQEARVAFGAMGPHPVRAGSVEQALRGVSLNAQSLEPALQAVATDLQAPDDALASGWYRQQVAPVHLRRLLLNEAA